MAFNRPPVTGGNHGALWGAAADRRARAAVAPAAPNRRSARRLAATDAPMPHVPEKGGFLHGVKFIFEIMWWALTAVWMIFKRLPKWVRALVTIWAVITLFSLRTCSFGSGNSNNRRDRDPDKPKSAVEAAKEAEFEQAAKEATKQTLEKFARPPARPARMATPSTSRNSANRSRRISARAWWVRPTAGHGQEARDAAVHQAEIRRG